MMPDRIEQNMRNSVWLIRGLKPNHFSVYPLAIYIDPYKKFDFVRWRLLTLAHSGILR